MRAALTRCLLGVFALWEEAVGFGIWSLEVPKCRFLSGCEHSSSCRNFTVVPPVHKE